MKSLKDVPINHATGDHSKCTNEWCHAKKALDNGKTYNRKPLFSSPQDDREIAQVKEIHAKFTTDEALRQMNHPWTTQPNESLNMRVAEYAPKHKHFSRSKMLQYRVYTAITIHNMGYSAFYASVARLLSIDSPYLLHWNKKRDVRKDTKKVYDNKIDNKRKRVYKANAKRKEDIYLESIVTIKDGDYKPKRKKPKKRKPKKHTPKADGDTTGMPHNDGDEGHDAIPNSDDNDQRDKPKWRRNRKTCDCGQGRVHSNKNYADCKYNQNNNENIDQASKENCDLNACNG